MCAEHLIQERKREAEVAAKEEPGKEQKGDDATATGEDGKADKDKENGAAGPDTANGGF